MKLQAKYIFSKKPYRTGIRFDIHLDGKNIAYALTKTKNEELWLEGLHVLPKYQGIGLAKKLIKEVEKEYKGNSIKIKAAPYKGKELNQKQLIDFYTKLGYKSIDESNVLIKKIK